MKDAGKLLTLLPKLDLDELLASALGTFEDELIAAGLRRLYRHQGSVLAAPFVQHELSGVDGRGAGKISILRPKSEHLHEEEIV